jgi:hypothetical protein
MRRINLEGYQAAVKMAGSGKERDWKSIQAKLVEKGYRRAPDLLHSERIRVCYGAKPQISEITNSSEDKPPN